MGAARQRDVRDTIPPRATRHLAAPRALRPGDGMTTGRWRVAAAAATLVPALAWLAGPVRADTAAGASAFEDTLAQRLLACTGCHGAQGRATRDGYFPRIAGKPAGYLFEQLRSFRDGRRAYAPMAGLLADLDDDYLREIAGHFAGLRVPHPPPRAPRVSAATLAHGRALALEGDASRGLPACADCHGRGLAGAAPAIPGLLGLSPDYLNAQLGAWRTGLRHAAAPDCMAQLSQRLQPEDIAALTAWLAAQPAPEGAVPRLEPGARLPLRCGSVEAEALARPAPAGSGRAGWGKAGMESGTPGESAPEAARIARGAYLARAGNCAGCHTERGGVPYAGGRGITTPFGTVYASNLTPDDETGIGRWSADDFRRALRDGRSKDGRALYPAFPYPQFTRVTRADADAIFAYLGSLPPVRRPNRAHALRFPFDRQIVLEAWRRLFFRPGDFVADPERPQAWNRGAYLVTGLAHCAACHARRNVFGAARDAGRFDGGLMPGGDWYAPSLHDPHQAGLADWPLAEIERLLGTGVAAGASVAGPMAEAVRHGTQHLEPADLRAIAVFLKDLPADAPAGARARGPAQASGVPARGERGYGTHCAQCHGERGEGVPGAYPALAGNRAVTMDPPVNLVRIVAHGAFTPQTTGNPRPFGMPPFAQTLDDAELAAILSYVRNAWGNRASMLSAPEVSRYRGSAGR